MSQLNIKLIMQSILTFSFSMHYITGMVTSVLETTVLNTHSMSSEFVVLAKNENCHRTVFMWSL